VNFNTIKQGWVLSDVHSPQLTIIRAAPRDDVRVTLPDASVYSAPVGTPIGDVLHAAGVAGNAQTGPVVGAIVENDLRELTFPIRKDSAAASVTLADSDGGRIYRRSLVFVLVVAAHECFPDAKVAVENALTVGGYYCRVTSRAPFTDAELRTLRERMRAIIAEDAPILRQQIPLPEAVAIFTARGDDDKLRLLENRTKDYLTIYRLHGYADYFYGYMLPSAGMLTLFDLQPAEADGFYLRYPRPEQPDRLQPIGPTPLVERAFRQMDEWLRVIGVEDIGRLNRIIRDGKLRETILIAEALHSRRIGEIAAQIAERHRRGARLVLIAGPSSAGKTTFSKRLAIQLMAYGIQPFTLAMDNYFVDRDLTPRDEAGNFDFEAVGALDRERMSRDILSLMANDPVQLPRFDFKLGRSTPGDFAHLSDEHVIIAEGIHGLNPELLPLIPPERVFRIAVSALTALNIDRNNRIPTTDVRLLRRMVRDNSGRGHSALATLSRWSSVRRGEKKYIFPYQENADAMFNSSIVYELAVLKPFAEPLLLQIERASPYSMEAKRLLAFVSWVQPAPLDDVPGDSLLREFCGGSVLEDYTPGALVRPSNVQ